MKYGVAIKGTTYVKVYPKKGTGAFTIPMKYFIELWRKNEYYN